MFSKLLIIVLLAATIGLYLKIVMIDDPATVVGKPPQASVQVVEVPAPAATSASPAAPKALPEDQMQLIREVFAPELTDK